MRWNRTTVLFLALAGSVALPAIARADLKFCNRTDGTVSVAIGHNSKEAGDWVSEGWWVLKAGECKVAIKGLLQNRYYYYYADDATGVWDGDYIFCTTDESFTIKGSENCKSRGYAPQGFREIDVGEDTSKTINLDP